MSTSRGATLGQQGAGGGEASSTGQGGSVEEEAGDPAAPAAQSGGVDDGGDAATLDSLDAFMDTMTTQREVDKVWMGGILI